MKRRFLIIGMTVAAALTGQDFISTVQVNGHAPSMYQPGYNLFQVTSESSDFTLPETINQTIASRESGDSRSKIIIRTGVNNRRGVLTHTERVRFLEETPFLNYNHPAVAALSSTVQSKGDSLLTALEESVYRAIPHKTVGIPMLPAGTIAMNGRGDCTEHAVLLTALLRQKKIPARAVFGMILEKEYDGEEDVFVFHMWTECWAGDSWVLLDATRPGTSDYHRYVAFGYHDLTSASNLKFLRIAGSIQEIKVTFLGRR